MSAWKDDEEEVPPSKIALNMINVLVSVICGWYVKIGCWGLAQWLWCVDFLNFTLRVLHSGAFQSEMMVRRYIWIKNE